MWFLFLKPHSTHLSLAARLSSIGTTSAALSLAALLASSRLAFFSASTLLSSASRALFSASTLL